MYIYIFIYVFYAYERFICSYVCTIYILVSLEAREGFRSPVTGLQMLMSCHVGAGPGIQVLSKSSHCS